jgi:hypothetical protein
MKKRPEERRKGLKGPKIPLIAVVLIVLGLGAGWLWPDASPSASGTPKLALDRTEIDLGYLRFNTPAHAAFTIANTGDGLLTLKPGRVRVVQGC